MSTSLLGRYEGRAIVELLDEGRVVSLVEAFSFVDHLSQRWDVPAKARVDGASIPRALWTIVGGPFEGKYRNASIIHDWFCDRRTRPWERVHEIFYEAMLTSGVSSLQARMLYTGVRLGGPRWSLTAVDNNLLAERPPAPAPPPPVMAPAPPKASPGFSFRWPRKKEEINVGAPPTDGAPMPARYPGPPPSPAAAPTPAPKPAAYSYELMDSDLAAIEEIARSETDLTAINKLVDQELKGRKRN
jgi:hypothetical protein